MYELTESEKLVDKIGNEILKYSENYHINEIYTYDFKFDNEILFTIDEIKRINKLVNNYERNVELKNILSKKLIIVNNKLDYYNWIVKDWGNINNFNKSLDDIKHFLKCINIGKLDSKLYDSISSYSKIISFINPDEYFIFDSKVAYVLNWLIIKNNTKENKYFKMPAGRNTDLVKYNIDTIACLSERKKLKYYDKKTAYFIYCEFIKIIFEKIKNNIINKPYKIEMLLYGLFNDIINEIKNKVKIIIE